MSLFALSRLEKRRLTVFLSSLVVAIFAWLFFALSSRYEYQVKARLSYVDPPLHRAFVPLNDDTVLARFSGTGWELLFSKFKKQIPQINVSLRQLENSSYVTFSGQLQELNRKFHIHQRLLSVEPDTLFFDFSKRMTKKVPVRLLYEIDFARAYGISGPVRLSPDSVVLSGAMEDLKNIHVWFTDTLRLRNVRAPIMAKVPFINFQKNNVNVFPKMVKVEIPVEEFTEQVVEVPLRVLNNQGLDVKMLPENISVTILSALGNYPQINRDSFQASVDLGRWRKYGYAQLPVILNKYPAHSKLVKIEPQAVDFLIQQ